MVKTILGSKFSIYLGLVTNGLFFSLKQRGVHHSLLGRIRGFYNILRHCKVNLFIVLRLITNGLNKKNNYNKTKTIRQKNIIAYCLLRGEAKFGVKGGE